MWVLMKLVMVEKMGCVFLNVIGLFRFFKFLYWLIVMIGLGNG